MYGIPETSWAASSTGNIDILSNVRGIPVNWPDLLLTSTTCILEIFGVDCTYKNPSEGNKWIKITERKNFQKIVDSNNA